MNEPAANVVPPQPEGPPASATLLSTRDRSRKSSGRLTNTLLVLAAIVAVGGITFALGRITAPAQTNAGGLQGANGQVFGQPPNGSFAPAAGQAGLGGGLTLSGTVSAINGSTLTMTTSDGRTLTVDLSGTTYHSQMNASAADVSVGTSVKVTVEGLAGSGGPNSGAGSSVTTPTLTATDVTVLTQ